MRKAIVLLFLVALSAQAEQKNVKLLTGLSDADLHFTMNMMRASMGTHCDYCHVVAKGTGWDWANDDKPPKRRARQMIQMVMDLNRNSFKGQPVISCFTCHRGSTKPLTLVELPQAAPPYPTPVPEEPKLPEAKGIVAKYAVALGDGSRLKLQRVVKGERTDWQQRTGPFELVENGPTPPEDEKMRILTAAFAPVSPADIGEDARTVAKEKIGDAEAWVVAQGTHRYWFDAASGLMLRRRVNTLTPIGRVPQQTDFEDYRDIGGTKFPFRIRVSFVDPWAGVTRQYSAVEIR